MRVTSDASLRLTDHDHAATQIRKLHEVEQAPELHPTARRTASRDFYAINEGVSLAVDVYDENDICEDIYVEFRPQKSVTIVL